MSALDRGAHLREALARRRAVGGGGRGVVRAFASAVVLGLVIVAVVSPVALAGPPPPRTVGPLLQLTPTSGRAAAPITAEYWFVDGNGAKCTYTTVEFRWDGKLVATAKVDPPDPLDLTYCSATVVFKGAPTPDPGNHIVSAVACYVDGKGVTTCPRIAGAQAAYVVLPTPTLSLVPASGLAASPFQATYSTGETGSCSFAEALFSWDGTAIGSRVKLDQVSCVAVLDVPDSPVPNGVGAHRVSADGCNRACSAGSRATATYTVLAPKPTATPTARPTPTPTPTPAPTATPSLTPSTSPSIVPSATPTTSPTPAPSPSLSPSPRPVLSPSVAPSPAPTPLLTVAPSPTLPPAGGVLDGTNQGSPPPAGGAFVPAMVTYIGGPPEGGIDPAVVATNLFLTLLLVFLFALTAEIFNSTMDANRDEIHGWWTRLLRGPLGFLGALTVPGASITRLGGSGRFGSIARVLAVLGLLGLVYGFLSADFGLNTQSAILFISLVVGLGFLTFFTEGSTTRLAASRYSAEASIRLYGTAVMVSIFAVVMSRLVTFEPGLVYGFVASAVVAAPVALNRRDDATLVLIPAIGLLVVSVLAWLLLGPIRIAAAGGAWAPGLAETILAMIVIGGLETLFVSMIPLRFMDGATVMGWNRVAWALTFGTVTFLWWQLLLNQDHAYLSALEQTNVQVVLAAVVVFMLTTGGLWSYFRFRPTPVQAGSGA